MEKHVGHGLKNFGPLIKLFASLLSQAGYGPGVRGTLHSEILSNFSKDRILPS